VLLLVNLGPAISQTIAAEPNEIISIDSTVLVNCNYSQGTAFQVRENLYMTAKHVVERCQKANLVSNDNESTTAKVVFFDPELDIALLSSTRSISNLVKFNNESVEKGKVEIVGAPIDGLVLSSGVINYVTSNGQEVQLHMSIPADHGNSGGPVFLSNEIVGMVYLKNFETGDVIAYGNPTLSSALNHYDLQIASEKDPEKLIVLGSELNQFWLLVMSIFVNLLFLLIASMVYFKNKRPRYIVGRNRIKIEINK
jgi:hypothetical protein